MAIAGGFWKRTHGGTTIVHTGATNPSDFRHVSFNFSKNCHNRVTVPARGAESVNAARQCQSLTPTQPVGADYPAISALFWSRVSRRDYQIVVFQASHGA
jgi:hypothetical protein